MITPSQHITITSSQHIFTTTISPTLISPPHTSDTVDEPVGGAYAETGSLGTHCSDIHPFVQGRVVHLS